jgi:hypothetical protein
VIVPADELELILSPRRLRRRAMRLPATGRCPVRDGHAYRLQPRLFARSRVTITVKGSPHRELLAALTLTGAREEGHETIRSALAAWRAWHGDPADEQAVWVVRFQRGDARDVPVYLAARGRDGGARADYTLRSDLAIREHGVPVEASVLPGAGEQARVNALASTPQAVVVSQLGGMMDTLAESMASMKARNRARLIAHQLHQLRAELPVSEVVGSGELSANGRAGSSAAPRPSSSKAGARP